MLSCHFQLQVLEQLHDEEEILEQRLLEQFFTHAVAGDVVIIRRICQSVCDMFSINNIPMYIILVSVMDKM